MSHKNKRSSFKFSLNLLVRWLIFATVIIFSFFYLSNNGKSPQLKILGVSTINQININPILNIIKSSLPQSSQDLINNFPNTSAGKYLEYQKNQVNDFFIGFPQKQFKELQKSIVNKVSDNIIKSIDKQ